jgi:hypothetical protein
MAGCAGNSNEQMKSKLAFLIPLSGLIALAGWGGQLDEDYFSCKNDMPADPSRYVSAISGDDGNDGANWFAPKATIQAAINSCNAGGTVWVSNGMYNIGSTVNPKNYGPLSVTNRVVITNGITVRSVNGPTNTFINGGINLRCVFMDTNTALHGFTLANASLSIADGNGGGVEAPYGEWLPADPLNPKGNARIFNCIFTNNTSAYNGGAEHGQAIFYNCLFYRNSGLGAVCGGMVVNCTSVKNSKGLRYCYIFNSVTYYNDSSDQYSTYLITNSCAPGISGNNNVSSDPIFVNWTNHNCRLQAGSPCIDKGTNMSWMTTTNDLDNNQRIFNNIVDMGCYEYGSSP